MFLRLLCLLVALFGPLPALAATPSAQPERAHKKEKKKASEEERSAEEAAAAAEEERKRKEKLARVIVLKWEGPKSADYEDETVRRNVRSRIGRPEAMFFPEVDLYQRGRVLPDRTVVPAMQPAIVPDSNVPMVLAAAAAASSIPWGALQPHEWRMKADELRALSESIWFVDRVDLREPLFLLYTQIGRAAENASDNSPPYFEQVGPFPVNYYNYLAATLAYQEPSLMNKLTDPEVHSAVQIILSNLQQGSFPSMTVDFSQEGATWNGEWFNSTYEVRLNGLPIELSARGQMPIFLGRSDIYLVRKDTGHGLSERLEFSKLEDRLYFIRDVARKKMGRDFIDSLFLHLTECNPEVGVEYLNYLAIYQKLHAKAEIYITVPENGNPNKVWIWRYVPESAMLKQVGGGPDNFPVRFALLFSSGLLYNGASMAVDGDFSDESSVAPGDIADDRRIDVDLDPATIPFHFELRGHYNRLMINLGSEFGYEAGNGGGWIEYYQTPGRNKDTLTIDPGASGCEEVRIGEDEDGNPVTVTNCGDLVTVLNQKTFNRYLYLGAGVVLGRDAGIGFGPRFAARVGWTNLPHAIQTTGHFGWAIQPGFLPAGNRVRPLLDADARLGLAVPVRKSLLRDVGEKKALQEVFGLTLGVGFTF